jgi:sulfur relay (sulfurtransferase) DsrC/TusE family protein
MAAPLPDITHAELEHIVLALQTADHTLIEELEAATREIAGESEPTLISPESQLCEVEVRARLTKLLADRLLANDHTVELITQADFVVILRQALEVAMANELAEFDAEDCEELGPFIEAHAQAAWLVAEAALRQDDNPYEELWRRVAIVRELAAQYNISPAELTLVPEYQDEIARRATSPNRLRKLVTAFTQPYLSGDMLRATMAGLPAEVRPSNEEVAEMLAKNQGLRDRHRAIIETWLEHTIARVWSSSATAP